MLTLNRANNEYYELIFQLQKVWENNHVDQTYRTFFISFIDALPPKMQGVQLAEQIRHTLENNTYYFRIKEASSQQAQVLQALKKNVLLLERRGFVSEYDLQQTCNLIRAVRSENLKVAEIALTMNKNISDVIKSDQFARSNNYIFSQLNQDIQFLKTSFLKQFIRFSSYFDPLFANSQALSHLDDQKLQCIAKLFELPISQNQQLRRCHDQMLTFLSGKLPVQKEPLRKQIKTYFTLKKQKSRLNQQKKSKLYIQNLHQTNILKSPQIIMSSIDSDYNSKGNRIISSRQNKRSFSQMDASSLNKISSQRKRQQRFYLPQINSNVQQSYVGSISKVNSNKLKFVHLADSEELETYKRKFNSPYLKATNSLLSPKSIQQLNKSIDKITIKEKEFSRSLPKREKDKQQRRVYFYPPRFKQAEQRLQTKQIQAQTIQEQVETQSIEIQANLIIDEPQNFSQQESNESQIIHPKFRMAVGKYTIENVFDFLKSLSIKSEYKIDFQIGNWHQSLRKSQYYLHKFYIDKDLLAFSLCCALPIGDIAIKCWAPLQSCNLKTSNFMFRKYIEHIQKNTLSKKIYFNGQYIKELNSNSFQREGERIFVRYRDISTTIEIMSDYHPFLTLTFVNISIPKSINKEILSSLVIPLRESSSFSQQEFICFNYLLIIHKLTNGVFSQLGSYTPNITMKEVKQRLLKQQIYDIPFNCSLNIPKVNLMSFKLQSVIFSAFFLANRPYVKLMGEVAYQKDDSMIVVLQLLKYRAKIYFGKGFQLLTDAIVVLKNRPKPFKSIQFCLKMCKKRMVGRISTLNLRQQACYGYFEMVFEWRDFLKGQIEQNIQKYEMFEQQPLMCIIQVDQQCLFGVQFRSNNFIK